MDDILSKPYRIKELEETVAQWLAPGNGVASAGAPQREREPFAEVDEDADREAPVDLRQLDEMRASLKGEFRSLVAAYIGSMAEMLASLPRAGQIGDLAAIERCGHGIKSTSQNVGAWRLAEMGAHLEQQAHSNSVDRLEAQIEAMRREFEGVRDRLLAP
jgi:HPt (histidine-containing phosphotransfer) domain-containing protein